MEASLDEDRPLSVETIQGRVRSMLQERASLPAEAQPSRYWLDFCSYFDYLLDMAPPSFEKLRLHTYHLTGDNYQTYYFGNRETFLGYWGPWLDVDGLPPGHVLSEPDEALNFGFRLDDGRLVNQDIARFQRSVRSLSRRGMLDSLKRGAKPARVLEIGGGYGGFAYHLSRIVGDCLYVIMDLPETLLFSAAYLTLKMPEKRLYLYEPGGSGPSDGFKAYDFILVPDYRLDWLSGQRFDLAVNLASMQEMRAGQVERYLDFLRAACEGPFYSCNRDRQNRNDEMPGLFELIRTRFDLEELPPLKPSGQGGQNRVRRSLRNLAGALGLASRPEPEAFPFVEHLGRSKSAAEAHSPSSSGAGGA